VTESVKKSPINEIGLMYYKLESLLASVVCNIGAEGNVIHIGYEVAESFFDRGASADNVNGPNGFGTFVDGPGEFDVSIDDVAIEFIFADAGHVDRLNCKSGFDEVGTDDGGIFASVGSSVKAIAECCLELFVFFTADGTGVSDCGVVDGEVGGVSCSECDGLGFEFTDGASGHAKAGSSNRCESEKRFFHVKPL